MVICPRIMPGALHVPDTRLPCWMSVQVVAPEGPPIPLPISDPDESEATALQVPDTDGDPLLPDDVIEDEGLVGPLHATDSAIETASAQRRYEDIRFPLSLTVAWGAPHGPAVVGYPHTAGSP